MAKKILHEKSSKKSGNNQLLLISILIITAFIAYFPSLQNDFTNYDDNRYIFGNTLLQTPSFESIRLSFISFFDGHYHPLTMLSYMLDYKIAQFNPFQYHLSNLILHLFNVLLVYLFILHLTKNKLIAFFTALLFGLQSMGVEAVAWASERKNVLYVFFFFLSLISYVKYLNNKKIVNYILSLCLFMFAVLSKSQALVLAPILIFIDVYSGRNAFSKKVIIEKIPFFIIAIIIGLIAQKAQASFWINSSNSLSLLDKTIFSSLAFSLYVIKSFIPFNLSVLYSYPEINGFSWIWLLPFIGFIFIAILIYSYKRSKFIFFGLGFFMVNIFFVLKFFNIPYGDYFMADRYSYLSSVGLFFIASSAINYLISYKKKLQIPVIGILVIYSFIIISHTRARNTVWKNGVTLWSSVIETSPDSFRAWNDRGNAKQTINDIEGAISDYNIALKIDPDNAFVYGNRGNARNKLKNRKGALEDYNKAIKLNPKYADAYVNRALTLMGQRKYNEAIKDLSKAISILPNYAVAYLNRANAYHNLKQYSSALADLDKCISLNSRIPNAYALRGTIQNKLGVYDGALEDFKIATAYGLVNHELQFETGYALYQLKDYQQSMRFLNAAIQKKKKEEYYLYRAYCYYQLKDFNKALTDLEYGIPKNSKDGISFAVRAYCNINLNKTQEACDDLNKAFELGISSVKKDIEKYCKN